MVQSKEEEERGRKDEKRRIEQQPFLSRAILQCILYSGAKAGQSHKLASDDIFPVAPHKCPYIITKTSNYIQRVYDSQPVQAPFNVRSRL